MTIDYRDLDWNIARTRIFVSVVGLLSIYVDPTIGEAFSLEVPMLVVLALHLAYGIGAYVYVWRVPASARYTLSTAVLDVLFATVISVLTEGPTSPGQIFFAFAIIAVGCRAGFRATLFVTAYGVLLYAPLIVMSSPAQRWAYVMRPVYLGIMGYLFSFLGDQRLGFEAALRRLETTAQRHTIARSLHDGYLQALASVNLRLKTCRELLQGGRSAEALAELSALESGVGREYDDIRAYVRALGDADEVPAEAARAADGVTRFEIEARFAGDAATVEESLQIMLEGMRNTRKHGNAASASIRARAVDGALRITIDDDGIGFERADAPPWSIASRVAQSGGRLEIARHLRPGAHLEIELPLS
jgi:signal transduction histidine kinase